MGLKRDPRLLELAKSMCRELRARETSAEKLFWHRVRNRKLAGLKFRRQHPLFFDFMGTETFYIADFYCHSKKLVIEIDGKIHNYQKERDKLRTTFINLLGIRVIRYRNEEIEQDLEGVLKKLRSELTG